MSAKHPEAAERLSLLERLISGMGLGTQGDPTQMLETYLGGTADVPLPWLREGLRRYASQPDLRFVPSLAEIRTSCALAIRRHRDEARGETGHSGTGQVELSAWHVEKAISFAATEVPRGVAAMHALYATERSEKRLRESAGPAPQSLPEALSPAILEGEGGDLCKFALALSQQGQYVPIWAEHCTPDAINGRLLAILLAHVLAGRDPMWPQYDRATHDRLDGAMARHKAAGGDVEWWENHRMGWKARARA